MTTFYIIVHICNIYSDVCFLLYICNMLKIYLYILHIWKSVYILHIYKIKITPTYMNIYAYISNYVHRNIYIYMHMYIHIYILLSLGKITCIYDYRDDHLLWYNLLHTLSSVHSMFVAYSSLYRAEATWALPCPPYSAHIWTLCC